jgi:hypothetical protein
MKTDFSTWSHNYSLLEYVPNLSPDIKAYLAKYFKTWDDKIKKDNVIVYHSLSYFHDQVLEQKKRIVDIFSENYWDLHSKIVLTKAPIELWIFDQNYIHESNPLIKNFGKIQKYSWNEKDSFQLSIELENLGIDIEDYIFRFDFNYKGTESFKINSNTKTITIFTKSKELLLQGMYNIV